MALVTAVYAFAVPKDMLMTLAPLSAAQTIASATFATVAPPPSPNTRWKRSGRTLVVRFCLLVASLMEESDNRTRTYRNNEANLLIRDHA